MIRRFPNHATDIRRRLAEDPTFRAICEDYGDARRAGAYWREPERAHPGRAEEYDRLVEELEAEALAVLTADEAH